MNEEERAILNKTLELSQENNKMLHSIRRQMVIGRTIRIVYWVLIIGAAIGLYYYIDPYINQAIGVYGNIKGDFRNFGDLLR